MHKRDQRLKHNKFAAAACEKWDLSRASIFFRTCPEVGKRASIPGWESACWLKGRCPALRAQRVQTLFCRWQWWVSHSSSIRPRLTYEAGNCSPLFLSLALDQLVDVCTVVHGCFPAEVVLPRAQAVLSTVQIMQFTQRYDLSLHSPFSFSDACFLPLPRRTELLWLISRMLGTLLADLNHFCVGVFLLFYNSAKSLEWQDDTDNVLVL